MWRRVVKVVMNTAIHWVKSSESSNEYHATQTKLNKLNKQNTYRQIKQKYTWFYLIFEMHFVDWIGHVSNE